MQSRGRAVKTEVNRNIIGLAMKFKIEIDRETDGRWICEIVELPGVLAYGRTRKSALASVQALALRVIADRLEHGELKAEPVQLLFEPS
jgi:predicted RNase H-like HicB family nuclease